MADVANKTLIILIHGGASSSRAYNNVVPLLPTDDFTVIAPDLPGHGTAASQKPFTFEAAVKSVTDCITQHSSSSAAGSPKVMLAGISLGGQVVLSFLQSSPDLIDAAIVSGASIHPPNEAASWELPHMPSDKAVVDMMMEDVASAGFENMPDLQAKSLGFIFNPTQITDGQKKRFPPVLVMVGEHDMAMQRRDFEELVKICKVENGRSEGLVLKGAWHNHNIDVPGQFAEAVRNWASKNL